MDLREIMGLGPEALTKIFGKPGEVDFPAEFQLECLGLDEKVIRELKGKRVLDVACGSGFLVESLRLQGIEAEGIDARAPDAEYFIRRNITGIAPMAGGIPRPDNHYGLVVCHSSLPSTYFSEFRNNHLYGNDVGLNMQAQFMVLESLRVLENGGRFVAFPGLDSDDSLRFTIGTGYVISREPFKLYEEVIRAAEKDKDIAVRIPSGGLFRTVITKEKK